MSPFGRY